MDMSSSSQEDTRLTMDVVLSLSRILNTGLDRETLSILMQLCEHGVNPDALAAVVKELRREAEVRQQKQASASQ